MLSRDLMFANKDDGLNEKQCDRLQNDLMITATKGDKSFASAFTQYPSQLLQTACIRSSCPCWLYCIKPRLKLSNFSASEITFLCQNGEIIWCSLFADRGQNKLIYLQLVTRTHYQSVHYDLEWKLTCHGKIVSRDTELVLVLRPSSF